MFARTGQLCALTPKLTGVDGAAAAVVQDVGSSWELVAATDPLAEHVDETHFVLGEGPARSSYAHALPYAVPNVGDRVATDQWPMFTRGMVDAGIGAVFTFPLLEHTRTVGVLELYRCTPGPMSCRDLQKAQACAALTVPLVHQDWTEYLATVDAEADPSASTAVASRRAQVQTASGMLAVHLQLSPQIALARLRAYSYRTGRPITDIADRIITRELPVGALDDTER